MTISKIARQFARKLRKNLTVAEKELWQHFRNKQFMGFKFLRQHPIFINLNGRKRFFIADFYCHELLLVIEVDGEIHQRQIDYDEMRSELLKNKKIAVIRFTNEEVLDNINPTLIRLKEKVDEIRVGSGRDG